MEKPGGRAIVIPENVRQVMALVLTVSAALLYGIVLGTAVVRTIFGPTPEFTITMTRAANLLSGLVGAVVTAGFARSERPLALPLGAEAPVGLWRRWKASNLARRNLLGLARTLGLPLTVPAPAEGAPQPEAPSTDDPADPRYQRLAIWTAVLYLAMYFVVGLAALLTSIWVKQTPEMVSQAGWVWLGTTVSAAYSFFGISGRV
ncbi:MAG: hypothetical protein V1772_05975 [Chloroflexota bacterium]